MKKIVLLVIALSAFVSPPATAEEPGTLSYDRWENGPSPDPGYFPIGVWLQSPRNASRYKEAGINLFIGLWEGPTEEQLADLTEAGMRVVCYQNEVGLAHIDDPIIAAWMHGDEPDNAQSDGQGGYGPPILPEVIIEDYEIIKANDPSRPVFLNLGQAVAWDNYIGRGVRRNHPEDYIEYVKGSDIASFDIYPVTSGYENIKGNLWYVATGVERLIEWSAGERIVWNIIETARIHADTGPTPEQVITEVWMSIIQGSRGIVYFVHEWVPTFNEYALLDNPEMLEAVTALNNRITELAPVLNSPDESGLVDVLISDGTTPIACTVRRYEGSIYVFAVAMRNSGATGTFTIDGLPEKATAYLFGEDRQIDVTGGTFADTFEPYEVHLYRIPVETSVEESPLPGELSILDARPNPFNPSTAIRYTTPATGHVRLTIHDITGREVAVLVDGTLGAGLHEAVWNGTDGDGHAAGSGVYIVRLLTGVEKQYRKITLMR